MVFNYNDPIDITAVNTAVKKHGKTLDAIPRLGADAILKHMTPLQGITDSYTFTKAVLKTVSSKYTGEFKGLKNIGKFVPRTLTVYPIVMEVLDEPERYRRSYVTEVRGAIEIAKHPFEMWLVQEILKQASNDLLGALATAKYSSADGDTAITDAFDSIPAIVEMLNKRNIPLENATVMSNIGMEDEYLGPLDPNREYGYFTTVLIKKKV